MAHYIEKAGTGTLDMIALCREAGLPEPEFRQDGGMFIQTLWRDWLTPSALARLTLNERQTKALALVRVTGRLTNADLRQATGAIARTVARDLDDLVAKGVLEKVGTAGRNVHYVLARKQGINGT